MPSALVTGGSSGIGLAIARMLRDEGYDLTLASRTREKVEAAAAELGAQAVTANTGDEQDCVRAVAAHVERFGGLDVLVNSAGIGIAGTVETLMRRGPHVDVIMTSTRFDSTLGYDAVQYGRRFAAHARLIVLREMPCHDEDVELALARQSVPDRLQDRTTAGWN